MGLDWDGPVRVQSAHLDDYYTVLNLLRARGLIYPCFCSRADIARSVVAAAPHGPDGGVLYPGTCRALSDAERAARMRKGGGRRRGADGEAEDGPEADGRDAA